MTKELSPPPARVPSWTFLTNHAHVLVCIAQDHEVRLAEIARRVGIGERAVHGIVQDLVDAGYVTRARSGSHNVYAVHLDRPLRHPLEAGHRIAEVFGPLSHPPEAERTTSSTPRAIRTIPRSTTVSSTTPSRPSSAADPSGQPAPRAPISRAARSAARGPAS